MKKLIKTVSFTWILIYKQIAECLTGIYPVLPVFYRYWPGSLSTLMKSNT